MSDNYWDKLKFIQRVLESDSPEADREAALVMCKQLRYLYWTEQTCQGWKPIESAPKDGTRILLEVDGVDRAVLGFWNGSSWMTIDANDWAGRAITKWMHIPALSPRELSPKLDTAPPLKAVHVDKIEVSTVPPWDGTVSSLHCPDCKELWVDHDFVVPKPDCPTSSK